MPHPYDGKSFLNTLEEATHYRRLAQTHRKTGQQQNRSKPPHFHHCQQPQRNFQNSSNSSLSFSEANNPEWSGTTTRSASQTRTSQIHPHHNDSYSYSQKDLSLNANRNASNLFFHLYNSHRTLNTIDLHRLFVEEAISALHAHLQHPQLTPEFIESQPVLCVITGKGVHSSGKAKLKPKITSWLRQKGLKHWEEEENPGCVMVCLKSWLQHKSN